MREIAVALVMLVVSGCAVLPTSGDYYEPTASEGKTQGYGDYDAPTTLVLRRGKDGEATVLVSGYFLGGSQVQNVHPSIEVRLLVPVGKSLRAELSAIRVYDDSSASIGEASPTYAMNRTRLHGDLKMDVGTKVYSGDTSPAYGITLYYTDIPIEGVPPKVLKVGLPAMEMDGIAYPPLTVTFTYTHGWWWQFYGP